MPVPCLSADRLSFAWSPDTPLFNDLSLSIGAERVGLVGANGAGKTTLLRLLLGDLAPASGHVARSGRFLYLTQRPAPRTTVAQALGIDRKLQALARIEAGGTDPADFDAVGEDWALAERAAEALAQAGVPDIALDRPLSSLSGGQATRVRLARIHLDRPELLVLDEPTNDLDAEGRAALYTMVRGWRGGLLAVSHDRTLLEAMNRIAELSGLGLRWYGGNYSAYRSAKELEVMAAERRLADAEKERDRIRRTAQEAAERAARRARIGKAQRDGSQSKMLLDAREDAAENHGSRLRRLAERQAGNTLAELEAARAELEIRRTLSLALPSTGLPRGKSVLVMEDVAARHPGAARQALSGLSLALTGPERVALAGPNGSGKSTALAVIAGRIAPEAGTVRLGVERWALLDQRLSLPAGGTVLDAVRARNPDLPDQACRAALATFLFRNSAALKPVAQLSGGERLRAALAAELAGAPPQLLMLDEPTNHLDLESMEALEAALRTYDGALLVVSHDPWFLDAIGIERVVEVGATLPQSFPAHPEPNRPHPEPVAG
ncbi:ABC-F family ATP-binding cassette domain-containing protein [Indioceanicola profundi]|uniref:ABC-F family ATP-binding cassette domain-containing protein n=1 Tax=Indioceanicola profundi TaxID=2220096 RepID=UPI000E6AC911|nr:ABC-F family ATP-binding cassette domain-containing protein [Indioceanicola profundi]